MTVNRAALLTADISTHGVIVQFTNTDTHTHVHALAFQDFLGQSQNPSSRSKVASLVSVTTEGWGPQASFITAASPWSSGSQKGFYSAGSAF